MGNINSNQRHLISVVVAVRNVAHVLQRCIDSVSEQSYSNKELIIIDGGSKDGTVDVLRANQDAISYWVSETDRGIYHAWNKGLKRAKGEWICFLGADDYFWDASVLERMANYLESLPSDVRLAYGQIVMVNRRGESLYTLGEPWEQAGPNFTDFMSIPHPGAMHRRCLFEQHGNFDETFRISGDYELLLRELITGTAAFVPIITVAMQHGGMSGVPSNALAQLRETRRAQRMHGQRFPSRIWMLEVVRVCLWLLLWNALGDRLARKILDLRRRMIGRSPYWTKA